MRIILATLILIVGAFDAVSQSDLQSRQHFNVKQNLAIHGYDPVSYFDGKPLEGNPEIKFVYKNITYQFASIANLAKFKQNPDKYEPAYGGWCAYAMGETGEKVKIDPETFTILDGRVYLFYNFWGNNTLKDWKQNEQKLKAAADHNWKNIVR